jgi:class 3 adenylate cyclase/tetratricopeptide (TPR) repeat protein
MGSLTSVAQQIADWLKKLDMSEYAERFAENDIDIAILPDLTDQHLKELGVSLGHRLKMLRAIRDLSGASPAVTSLSVATKPTRRDEAERRQLTVMFCDLIGSTALSTRLDPEDMREIIGAYHRCCVEQITKAGGFVAKYMGDGVLAYFGYPHAHEDDAERAVRSALALTEALPKIQAGHDAVLAVRLGIATGLVVVGDLIGEGDARERGVVGDTPNLAARLQAIAEPNTVVIAESTRALLGSLFELKDLGLRDLKGIAGPVRAWVPRREASVESRFEALHAARLTALVGRAEECETLHRRWQRAKTGEGQVVLLSGEAGIGKSRLTAELLERLANEPHTRLRYFCSPQHTDSALYPIISQLERAAGFVHDDAPHAKLNKLDALLARTGTSRQDAALFAGMLSLANDGRYPTFELDPQQRREKTFEALTAQLEVLSRSSPVLMIFEDVHWIDATSLEVLSRTVQQTRALRVLLVGTYRPEFEPLWIGRPHVTALTLSRLGQLDTSALIAQLTGNKALAANIRQDIIERADGIPLFVEEMTKALLEAGSERPASQTAATVPSPGSAVPASLHASLMARLDRLGSAKELAQIGAVVGREFSHALLATVARKSQEELQSALDRLIAAGLLFRQGVTPRATYLFKHALVRDAAYGTLLREPRRELHARVAGSLEREFAEVVASQPHLIAQHCTEAGLYEKATGYWLMAGEQAVSRSAMIEAEALLRKGLSLISKLTDSKSRSEHELNLQITLGLALSQTKGFHSQVAGEAYSRARQLCDELKRPRKLLPILYGQWINCLARGQVDHAEQYAAEISTLAELADDIITKVVGCRAIGGTNLFRGDFPIARTSLEQGLALYDPSQRALYANVTSVDTHVALLGYLAPTLACSGQFEQARLLCDEAIAEARGISHAPTMAHILWMFWWAGWFAGSDPRILLPFVDELVALTMERNLTFWHTLGMVSRGWCLVMLGQGQQGLSLIAGAARDLSTSAFGPLVFTLLADAARIVGQAEVGLAHLIEASSKAETTHIKSSQCEVFRLRGLLSMEIREHGVAETSFRDAIALAQCQGAKSFELRASLDLARIWRDQGKRAEARDLLAPIYGWFTEGFNTPVLQDAKALLDELR